MCVGSTRNVNRSKRTSEPYPTSLTWIKAIVGRGSSLTWPFEEAAMQTMASNSFVDLAQRFIEASKNWFRRRACVNEVTNLDSEELSCIAHELGVPAAELR